MAQAARANPPNEFGALYTSLEATSAAKEVARGLRQRGVDPDQFPESAWWVYELEVKLEAVLDLTNADVLQKSGIAEGSLTGSGVNATRQIAAEFETPTVDGGTIDRGNSTINRGKPPIRRQENSPGRRLSLGLMQPRARRQAVPKLGDLE